MRNLLARRALPAASVAALTILVTPGCSSSEAAAPIEVSGSSTVAPITEAIARDGRFDVEVTAEGTTDGFDRFCSGETPINNASEAIPGPGQRTDYVAMCAENGVEYIELPIGLDALSLVRNEANDFADDLTMDELKRIWSPDSEITSWRDIRPDWPAQPISLYGRPDGSGTFDYFTHFAVGEAGSIRSDYRATDDMTELARWIAEDENSLGFMGAGNYLAADEEYRDRIANVAVDGVSPSRTNAQDGTYQPLTRPLFIYVSAAAFEDAAVTEFVDHYLRTVRGMLPRVFFYALPTDAYPLVQQRFEDRITGTMFGGDPFAERPILQALQGS
ncbi:PstS family phosphate ABC transporter substrate-binding protein [Hoyosella subflava]|uniref:Phosphate ABC superfamily ATP binding cassette transporter, binding protein n=1 Tax=Hoyosella subflava (strain DSM 45089 / JCM 17490 / NBRC 109087 / DQS3-9A1) TaxID=443218 RepID=F6EJI1_HOYSD|nr:PstS family phosphate ABC transporter substrate-binding protein [Hoyosella subflava]AEF39030.1 Phosphate ABC superfamily ATP binding cassette transporter, binding protein [Hoyosella subflava DQS3-9A1]